MPRPVRLILGWTLLALIVGAPWAYAKVREQRFRNFHVVHPGKLYRSGQLNRAGLERLIREQGIRTVVNLRDGSSRDDQAEEAFCQHAGVNFHRLSPLAWWASDGTVPAQANVDRFRAILRDPNNWPVLVHCFAGHHRTGAMCATCRMDIDGWTNEQALEEMKALGYSTIDGDLDILDYLKNYRPPSSR